jgi:VanZ family protein
MRHRAWIWGPAVAHMGLIFFLSSLSEAPLPDGITAPAGHGLGYAMLGMLLLRALADATWAGVTPGRAALAVLLSTAYGLTDEYHQSFVPGRMPAWDDVGMDFAGALAGAGVVLILRIINKLWLTRT